MFAAKNRKSFPSLILRNKPDGAHVHLSEVGLKSGLKSEFLPFFLSFFPLKGNGAYESIDVILYRAIKCVRFLPVKRGASMACCADEATRCGLWLGRNDLLSTLFAVDFWNVLMRVLMYYL